MVDPMDGFGQGVFLMIEVPIAVPKFIVEFAGADDADTAVLLDIGAIWPFVLKQVGGRLLGEIVKAD
jgi:hypothetical protein